MKNKIFRCRKAMILCLVVVLLLTVPTGCVSSNNLTPVSLSETSVLISVDEIPEGMLLPFAENGKPIWNASEIDWARLDYFEEGTEGHFLTLDLSLENNMQAFIDLLNEMQKELVGVVKDDSLSFEEFFAEFDYGTEVYYSNIGMSMSDQLVLSYVFHAADCGYLWFHLVDLDSDPRVSYHSLYKISLNSFQKLDQLFQSFSYQNVRDMLTAKPVLYLYPEYELDVSVKLAFQGSLTVTYPTYNDGWNVRAYPDGHLINKTDGLEYSYLFWEGVPKTAPQWNLNEGYCVAGADTASFLQKTLSELGLTPREYNEFIVYWLPQMQDNPYNLITFQWEEYESLAPLTIYPTPDSVLRVFMVFAPLEKPVDITSPALRAPFVRNGFTVVEWGATKIEYNH